MSINVVAPGRDRSALALILAGILWGTGGLSGSLLGTHAHLQPLSVATYRLLLGGGLAVALLAISGWLPSRGRKAGGVGGHSVPRTRAVAVRILLTGALLGLYQACYFIALQYISLSIATMTTIGMVPVFVALGTALRTRVRPTTTTLLTIATAVAGLGLLTWSPGGAMGGWRLLTGVGFALLCALGFGVMTVLSARPVAGLDPLRTTAFGMLTGGLLLLPAAAQLGMTLPLRPDVLALAAWFASAPTAIAYTAYFLGLRTAAPVFAAISALLEPLTATILGVIILGDRLTIQGCCGAVLLLSALAINYHDRLRSGS